MPLLFFHKWAKGTYRMCKNTKKKNQKTWNIFLLQYIHESLFRYSWILNKKHFLRTYHIIDWFLILHTESRLRSFEQLEGRQCGVQRWDTEQTSEVVLDSSVKGFLWRKRFKKTIILHHFLHKSVQVVLHTAGW